MRTRKLMTDSRIFTLIVIGPATFAAIMIATWFDAPDNMRPRDPDTGIMILEVN